MGDPKKGPFERFGTDSVPAQEAADAAFQFGLDWLKRTSGEPQIYREWPWVLTYFPHRDEYEIYNERLKLNWGTISPPPWFEISPEELAEIIKSDSVSPESVAPPPYLAYPSIYPGYWVYFPIVGPIWEGTADIINDRPWWGGLNIFIGLTDVLLLKAFLTTPHRLLAREGLRKGSTEAFFLARNTSPRIAGFLAQPYKGMGSHFIKRELAKYGIPQALIESRLSVVTGTGMTRGEFYVYHFLVDKSAKGFRLPARFGKGAGSGWSGASYGLKKIGPYERFMYGSPLETKLLIFAPISASGRASQMYVTFVGGESPSLPNFGDWILGAIMPKPQWQSAKEQELRVLKQLIMKAQLDRPIRTNDDN